MIDYYSDFIHAMSDLDLKSKLDTSVVKVGYFIRI